MLLEAGYYSRMALGVYQDVRTPPLPDPEGAIRKQLASREAGFLETVRRVVFDRPENPYHPMFRLAGCSYEDLARSVGRDGLEGSLAALHREGVYLTHDESKGKQPIVRSGRHIASNERSFVNPLVSGGMEASSSGSRSKGTRTRPNVRCKLYREAYRFLAVREFGLQDRVEVALRPILPSAMGISACLRASRRHTRLDRWFTVGGTMRDSGHYRVVTNVLVLLGKLLGAKGPLPTYLPRNDFSPVAEWVARRRAEGIACAVRGVVSPAVRVAAAAMEKGLDIRGTLFFTGGEALTDAKRGIIEATGAEVFPSYWIHEVGAVGHACRQMNRGNCVHLFHDSTAVISHRRPAPFSDVEVDSLFFTTLLPFTPLVLINAEMDDSGVLEEARCDCTYARMGFTKQIRDIASFGKLTGQGMTLVGTDLVRILEEALPKRFGGGPGDYQLVEREAGRQTQLLLRVSPRAGLSTAEGVKDFLLKELRKYYGGSLAARVWRHAEAVEVEIAEPFSTFSGKVLPLHLLGPGTRQAHVS